MSVRVFFFMVHILYGLTSEVFLLLFLDKVNNKTLPASSKTGSWVGRHVSVYISYSIRGIVRERSDKSVNEQIQRLHFIAWLSWSTLIEQDVLVHPAKQNRSHSTFISSNQPVANMCLPHGCLQRLRKICLCEGRVLGIGRKRACLKGRTHIKKWLTPIWHVSFQCGS